MTRGVEIDIHLNPTLTDEMFVAEALGNLAAFELGRDRREALRWQVLHITGMGPHHFRLVIAHPDRALDLGLTPALKRTLDRLSSASVEGLRQEIEAAKKNGLTVVPIRTVHEAVDYWRDDFWNWFG
ncbi:MAG TPA: hypothetical protein VMG36_02825 [Thermoplasmata archaeon]|nr:hypothetical protein [Thermoplasmata archaeon]